MPNAPQWEEPRDIQIRGTSQNHHIFFFSRFKLVITSMSHVFVHTATPDLYLKHQRCGGRQRARKE